MGHSLSGYSAPWLRRHSSRGMRQLAVLRRRRRAGSRERYMLVLLCRFLSSSFIQLRTTADGDAAAHVQSAPPSSVQSLLHCPHRYTQRRLLGDTQRCLPGDSRSSQDDSEGETSFSPCGDGARRPPLEGSSCWCHALAPPKGELS